MKLKLILPAVAFLFAIVGALANVTTSVTSIAAFPSSNPCSNQQGTCTEDTSLPQCQTSGGVNLYKNPGTGVCTTILRGTKD